MQEPQEPRPSLLAIATFIVVVISTLLLVLGQFEAAAVIALLIVPLMLLQALFGDRE